MYLKRFIIKRFRGIAELNLALNKGVNILIGKNNSGKSAIIDALRICLGIGKQKRDIGINSEEDFYIDINNVDSSISPIEFDLFFEIENNNDRSYFHSMVSQDEDPAVQDIQLHFRYYIETNPKGNKVLRWKIWAGNTEGCRYDDGEIQNIQYVYLAALRDAERELRPYSKENRLSSLFRELNSYTVKNETGEDVKKELLPSHKDQLAAELQTVIQGKAWQEVIKAGESLVNEHLDSINIEKNETSVDLQLIEYKYENIVKTILTRKPVFDTSNLPDLSKQRFFDVSQNGLGENNLIYTASVLGDLKNKRNEDIGHYYALLIEEPEAHLHPQKQNTLFNYLSKLSENNLQLFVTSHSPTITAKSNLDNIIIINKVGNENFALPLNKCEMDADDKSYLSKFLDVTKSQLFFSNGCILVEGISEALLLPSFTRKLNASYDLDKSGIEIVNISGVTFNPFAALFNNQEEAKRLATRCSLITDGDEHRYDGNRSSRATNIAALPNANLKCYIAKNTFEYEIMTASEENADTIIEVYKTMHPRTDFLSGDNLHERAMQLIDKLDSNKDKSELAQRLAKKIEDNSVDFDIPNYIENAVKWVLNEE